MTKKRNEKRKEMREKKLTRQKRRLESQGRMVESVKVTSRGIPADFSKQTPSLFNQRHYYKDQEVTCVDCGTVEIWTAKAQQWYFEELKAHPASRAVRCTNCRKRRRKEKEEQRRHMEELDAKKK